MKNSLKHLILIICFGCFASTLQAQINVLIDHSEKTCRYCVHGDHKGETPYTINFKNELPYFAASLGLLGTGLLIKEKNGLTPFTTEDLDKLDGSSINGFDKGAIRNNSESARKYSNYTLISGAALPLYFLTNHFTQKDFLPLLVMGAEVFTITSTITLNAKYSFNRTRPLAYNPDFSDELRTDETSRISFFSGHTATLFLLFVILC